MSSIFITPSRGLRRSEYDRSSSMFGRPLGDLIYSDDLVKLFHIWRICPLHSEELNEVFYDQKPMWRFSWFRRSSRFEKSAGGFSRFRRTIRDLYKLLCSEHLPEVFYVQVNFRRSSRFKTYSKVLRIFRISSPPRPWRVFPNIDESQVVFPAY